MAAVQTDGFTFFKPLNNGLARNYDKLSLEIV